MDSGLNWKHLNISLQYLKVFISVKKIASMPIQGKFQGKLFLGGNDLYNGFEPSLDSLQKAAARRLIELEHFDFSWKANWKQSFHLEYLRGTKPVSEQVKVTLFSTLEITPKHNVQVKWKDHNFVCLLWGFAAYRWKALVPSGDKASHVSAQIAITKA